MGFALPLKLAGTRFVVTVSNGVLKTGGQTKSTPMKGAHCIAVWPFLTGYVSSVPRFLSLFVRYFPLTLPHLHSLSSFRVSLKRSRHFGQYSTFIENLWNQPAFRPKT